MEASRLERGTINIDGELSDSGWESASRIESFVEYFKSDNTAPPAQTVALLAYDAQFLYVAFRADDPTPASIRAPFVDRDKVLGDQDYVAVLLDTQNDRRSGVAFRVNARGIQTDSVVNDANGVEDFSPDFFYESVARPTATGWAAEMRIPLSSLRYPDREGQSWGVILMRNYPRDFRYIMSNTPIPKNTNCFVCHASTLAGLASLPKGGHITIAPYSTAQSDEHRSDNGRGLRGGERSPIARDPLESDLGLDLKWNPSAKLTIDGTLNPDFSQIESDVPQLEVNNRFALEYPEKRTFFLEGVDLLSTPIRAVYSRTITSPAWGMRATGQSAAGAYTLFVAEDRGGGSVVLPGAQESEFVPQDFRSRVVVGRLRRSFGNSFGGLLLTTREIEGGGHNRVFGPDLHWKPTAKDRVLTQLLFSDTENPERPELSQQFDGRKLDGHGIRLVYSRDSERYDIWSEYREFSPGFRADNGFVPQVGFRRMYGEMGGRFYPKNFASYFRSYFAVERDTDYDSGDELRLALHPGFYFQGKWNSEGWMTFRVADRERIGDRRFDYRFIDFWTRVNPWRALPALEFSGQAGEKLDYASPRRGTGAKLDLKSTIRPTDHLELQVNATRDWLDADSTRVYTAQLERLKLTYTFSARSLVRLIGQYSDVVQGGSRDGSLSTSALYGYKLNWQTVFFVGYGDQRLLDERSNLLESARSVFMKVSYAFQR